MKLGLENISKLLAALGNPQNNYLKVQVAGTNGKGSVCAFLDSICNTAGISTGTFTSPHLISITERIRINGSDIGEADFARHATHVRKTVDSLIAKSELEFRPTFFEQVTAIALIAFADAKVKLAILETGLGGRLDATTAANAEIAAITRIDFDHQEYLGETIEQIAAEKAAIIRSDSVVCVGPQQPEAIIVINNRCAEVGVTPNIVESKSFDYFDNASHFNVAGFAVGEVELSLLGLHQVGNAALAILLAKHLGKSFTISDMDIVYGLEKARHPGRLEWCEQGGVRILLDGAHNTAGAVALADYLGTQWAHESLLMIYASMKEKDSTSILKVLSPLATDIIFTETSNSRSTPAVELAAITESLTSNSVFVVPDPWQALDSAIRIVNAAGRGGPAFVVITGSLYLVGEVKKILNN